MNRPIAALYTPGSTAKLLTAGAALEAGKITENTYLRPVTAACSSAIVFPVLGGKGTWSIEYASCYRTLLQCLFLSGGPDARC